MTRTPLNSSHLSQSAPLSGWMVVCLIGLTSPGTCCCLYRKCRTDSSCSTPSSPPVTPGSTSSPQDTPDSSSTFLFLDFLFLWWFFFLFSTAIISSSSSPSIPFSTSLFRCSCSLFLLSQLASHTLLSQSVSTTMRVNLQRLYTPALLSVAPLSCIRTASAICLLRLDWKLPTIYWLNIGLLLSLL